MWCLCQKHRLGILAKVHVIRQRLGREADSLSRLSGAKVWGMKFGPKAFSERLPERTLFVSLIAKFVDNITSCGKLGTRFVCRSDVNRVEEN